MKFLRFVIGYILTFALLGGIAYLFYSLYESGYSLLLILLIGIYIFNVIFTFIVFMQIRHSGAKLSWLMVMAIFPFFGQFIFVIFGQRYKNRMSIFKYRKKYTFEYEKINNEVYTNDDELSKLLKRQSNISNRGIYMGDFKIFTNGGIAYRQMFDEMRNAKNFIHIQYYIIKPGEIFEEFKSILIQKAKEGVEIRFIIDDFGRWALPWYEIKLLKSYGIMIGIFGKVHFPFLSSENGFRNHRKMVIIDGEKVFTGGLNIADEYANLNKNFGLWIDLQTKITGSAVRSYSLLFIQDWNDLTSIKLDPKEFLHEENTGKSHSILVEDSPLINEPIMQDSLCKMILSARERINITTPYFIPTTEIFSALRAACLAGVEVNIFIPGKADKQVVLWSTRHYVDILQSYGANIYEAKEMLIHSKVGSFDSKYAYLGTANIDVRSLYAQFEFLSIVGGPVVDQIENLFEYYKQISFKVEKGAYSLNIFSKLLRRFYVNLFSPIM